MSKLSNDRDDRVIVVEGAEDAIRTIRAAIDAQEGSGSQITTRRNLDGDVATWIVVATLSAQALPHILSFIKDLLQMHMIKKIKVGDVEVENPTRELVEQLSTRMKFPPAPGNS